MQDIRNKGAKTVSLMPNRKSLNIIHTIVRETEIGSLSLNEHPGTLTLSFNRAFITGRSKLFGDKIFIKTKTVKPDYDLYNYYFTCKMNEDLAKEYFSEIEK